MTLRRIAIAILIAIAAIAGVVLVFNQQRRARETQTAAAAAPRNGRFIDAGDLRIFVQESGPPDAPAVLLVHGTGTWSEIWRETIDALSADHRVIAVDLPPFGYSDKPAVASAYTREAQARRLIRVIESLQVGVEQAFQPAPGRQVGKPVPHHGKVTIVGHSVGARPVVEVALLAPQLLSKLILVDPALGFQSKRDDAPHFAQNRPSWIQQSLFSTPSLRTAVISAYGTNPMFLRQVFRSFVSNKSAVTQGRLDVIERPMHVRGTTAAYGAWLNVLTTSEDRSLSSDFTNFRRLSMPVAILWGRTDSVTPLWQGERLQQLIPHSQLVILDGVGHIPYIEDPPRFTAALRKLLP